MQSWYDHFKRKDSPQLLHHSLDSLQLHVSSCSCFLKSNTEAADACSELTCCLKSLCEIDRNILIFANFKLSSFFFMFIQLIWITVNEKSACLKRVQSYKFKDVHRHVYNSAVCCMYSRYNICTYSTCDQWYMNAAAKQFHQRSAVDLKLIHNSYMLYSLQGMSLCRIIRVIQTLVCGFMEIYSQIPKTHKLQTEKLLQTQTVQRHYLD